MRGTTFCRLAEIGGFLIGRRGAMHVTWHSSLISTRTLRNYLRSGRSSLGLLSRKAWAYLGVQFVIGSPRGRARLRGDIRTGRTGPKARARAWTVRFKLNADPLGAIILRAAERRSVHVSIASGRSCWGLTRCKAWRVEPLNCSLESIQFPNLTTPA